MIFNTKILLSLIILSLIMINTVYSATNSPVSNSDSFVLSCGATNPANDSNARTWIPDTEFLSTSDNTFTSTARLQDPSLPSTVPYMDARIFKSNFTYKFSVTSSPHVRYWIRLHFYPSLYNNFNCSNSFFSVTANEYTLLNNFSAAITAQALTQAYIIREFSLNPMDVGKIDLKFVPSSDYEDCFAFVNGIEVISMPQIFQSAEMVGYSGQSIDQESFTFQTMIRLNVGGEFISPDEDSGLTRIWYNDMPYLYGSAAGVAYEANTSVPIVYPEGLPKYIAPVNVYKTGRSMGPVPEVNEHYNLTWLFEVDANFTYLVRLHLCEYWCWRVNQRVFKVYINNHTASEDIDIFALAGGRGVPMYKDYAVHVTGVNGDQQIWVALHPNTVSKPQYNDAALGGLEIFKMSDTRGNLAGPNPVPSDLLVEAESNENKSSPHSKSKHIGLIVGLVIGALACLGLILGLFFILKRCKKGSGNEKEPPCGVSWLPIYSSSGTKKTTNSGKSTATSHISSLGKGICRHFSLADIRLATNNFDEAQVIGVGGFGKVYKGTINGNDTVAIKRANPSSQQGIHEFLTEIDLLSKLRHRHLVSLIGACEEEEEMILVYDYMANGTLREHLTRRREPPLSWVQRLNICIGAARGLHYLHTGARHTIIHRDVKTTNILLDDKWVAKVSDFGLSKTAIALNQTHVSTAVKGSFGYMDPEYFRRQQLTEKSDVYSFGVVLFEVLCAMPPINTALPKEQACLADWAQECHKNSTLGELIDPRIEEEIYAECLKSFVDIAISCLADQGSDRPTMGSVLWNLEYALQLQNNPDGPRAVAEQKANDAYAMNVTMISIEEEGEGEGSQDQSQVFSQIINPQGR